MLGKILKRYKITLGRIKIRNIIVNFLLILDYILECFGRPEEKSLAIKYMVWREYKLITKVKSERNSTRQKNMQTSHLKVQEVKQEAYESIINER